MLRDGFCRHGACMRVFFVQCAPVCIHVFAQCASTRAEEGCLGWCQAR